MKKSKGVSRILLQNEVNPNDVQNLEVVRIYLIL